MKQKKKQKRQKTKPFTIVKKKIDWLHNNKLYVFISMHFSFIMSEVYLRLTIYYVFICL